MSIKKVNKDSVKIHIKRKPEIHAKKRRRQKANVFAKAAKVETAKVTAKQVDGGEEMQEAALLAQETLRPVSAVTDKGSKHIKSSIQHSVRSRRLKFFVDKVKAEQKQTDSVSKKMRDMIGSKAKFYVGKAALAVLGAMGGILSLVALVAVPVVVIITLLYHSPLALFLPPFISGDTVQVVTDSYVSDFITEVETLANNHAGYDEGEIYYRDSVGNVITPGPQKDIMCVYMVKYGVGEMANVMNHKGKKRLKGVVDDMCQYSTTDRTEERKDAKGKKYDITILEVNAVIKDYQDMIAEYGFSQEQIELVEVMMRRKD